MSKIEWTDETWNPVIGCSPASEGCRHCYAARMAHRLASNPTTAEAYAGLATAKGWTGEVRLLPERLEIPLRWRKPRRVFVCSMGDPFHQRVTHEQINAVWHVMMVAQRHTFQVLTKRPLRMSRWFRALQYASVRSFQHVLGALDATDALCWHRDLILRESAKALSDSDRLARDHMTPWPAPNIWLGTTVESAKHLDRIDHLRACPAAIRFLSCEPLLGPLGDLDLTGIHWVIVGGETGPGARPMHPAWAREIRDQCDRQGVPLFFKSHGGRKKDRMLDGRMWEEMPV